MRMRISSNRVPASVVAAGLEFVWHLPNTTGTSGALMTVATAVAGGLLPSGSSASGNNFTINGSCTITGLDFSGFTVWISGDGTVATINNCKFSAPRLGFLASIGQHTGAISDGSPTVTFNHCTFDYTGMLGGNDSSNNSSGVASINASIANFNDCKFIQAPRDFVNTAGTNNLSFTRCFFGAFGVDTTAPDHLESIHAFGGTLTVTNCLFNPAAGSPITGGKSGMFQLQGTNSALTNLFSGCIIVGGDAVGMGIALLFLFSMKAVSFNVFLTITGCVIAPGASGQGIVGVTNQSGTCSVTDGGGNLNFYTGASITGFGV